MKQQLFEQQHAAAWERFERQLQTLERPQRQEPTESLTDFARQYRLVCHLLALAQERHYSPYLIDRLNDLALRGHQHFYQRKRQVWHDIVQFVVWGFPAAIRRESRFVWLGVLLFFVPALVMGTLTYFNPNMIYTVYPHEAIQQMVDMYDPANNRKMADERGSSQDLQMFGFYIRNNVGIGFQTFASGILLGIGAIFHLLFNGLVIGAVAGYLTELGHGETFWPFVIGHGAFELTAIAIAGGAGLKLGYGLLAPGRLTRKQSLIQAARGAMPLVYGIFFFLVIAAFIEAFWSSSSVLPIKVKLVVGGLFWLLVILYLSLGWRRGYR